MNEHPSRKSTSRSRRAGTHGSLLLSVLGVLCAWHFGAASAHGQIGACCYTSDGSCVDGLDECGCLSTDGLWTAGVLCANLSPPCQLLTLRASSPEHMPSIRASVVILMNTAPRIFSRGHYCKLRSSSRRNE